MTLQPHRILLLAAVFAFVLSTTGCSNLTAVFDPSTAMPTWTASPLPTVTLTPTSTPPPTDTLTPPPTITPTPAWVFQPVGRIVCPILLYHHIGDPPTPDSSGARYYTPSAGFEKQMQVLNEWGYTSIPISLLVTAITQGAELPPRPVVITFDDGDISVYTSAFPIMRRYGFVGVIYLVANRLDVDGYMNVQEVNELTAAGWEVGSHGMSHIDLQQAHDRLETELSESKVELIKALGVPVDTFAYPFGAYDSFIGEHVRESGYRGAVGLGVFWTHSRSTLLYLSRIEIRNGTDLAKLAAILPWSGPVDATLTPTFTPTFTPTYKPYIFTLTP